MASVSDDEVRYEDGRFKFPEKEEGDRVEEEGVKKSVGPSYRKKLVARAQAWIVTFMMAVLKAIFRVTNYLLVVLSRLI